MIFDSHCHIWQRWPYEPPVPDPESRGAAEQLVWHMDRNGVDRALVICAAIGDNPRNADDAFAAAARHPGRLVVFPDLECRWSPVYGTPGARDRLAAALDRWPMQGFTTYLAEADSGEWLVSADALAMFRLAGSRGLIASLSVMPQQMPHVAALARAVPGLVLLCHHHAHLGPRSAGTKGALGMVLAAASEPGVHVKLSGMGNVAGPDDEYPYAGLGWIGRALFDAFGPDRLLWGSDFPVSARHMTYRQALDMVRRHGPGTAADRPALLGGNLARLLGAGASVTPR